MAPFSPTTEDITDAQRRLAALGHDPFPDPPGTLGDATAVALQGFQRQRGLPLTGQLDEATWRRLLEASWRLGDRLLYLDQPLQRGDDVADLQEALAKLGFDPGRIDGIFGPLTATALGEFQDNCGLARSGVLDRGSLIALSRLSARSSHRAPVTAARDAAGLGTFE